ncbi:hypothetical protein BLX88_10925 [Bacillus obstructivus]|nr:hypothetical protein BLX88_10925 [Bacillus obstructivus]
MESYINPCASLIHYCKRCGVEFYGKPSHMLGKDSQKHLCTLPYGDCHGERLSRVKRNYISKGKKNKNADKQGTELANKLDELINQGLSTLIIRQQTGVEPRIIEYYKQTFHSRD